jgi:hypothetical protein
MGHVGAGAVQQHRLHYALIGIVVGLMRVVIILQQRDRAGDMGRGEARAANAAHVELANQAGYGDLRYTTDGRKERYCKKCSNSLGALSKPRAKYAEKS